jgi:hypothetical protein
MKCNCGVSIQGDSRGMTTSLTPMCERATSKASGRAQLGVVRRAEARDLHEKARSVTSMHSNVSERLTGSQPAFAEKPCTRCQGVRA